MFNLSVFDGPIFWIIMGMVYCVVICSSVVWAKDLGLKMSVVKWLVLFIWFGLLSAGIGAGFTLMGENEMRAGVFLLGIIIVICTILGVALWRWLSAGRNIPKEKSENRDVNEL